MLSGTILGFVLFLASAMLGLLVVGTFCSSLDDTKFPHRIAALIRIGKRVGIVFKGSGPDFAVALFGEDAVSDSQEEKARKRLKSLQDISEELPLGRCGGVSPEHACTLERGSGWPAGPCRSFRWCSRRAW